MKSKLKIVFSKEDIAKLNRDLGGRINQEYAKVMAPGEELLVVVTLKGAILFAADLVREIQVPVKLDFIRCSSYGAATTTSGNVVLKKDLEHPVSGKHVLILDEIVDSGFTLSFLIQHFKALEPKSLKVCALLDKKSRRQVKVDVDYIGREVEDLFLVGYGLDFDENYRNLPEIYELTTGE